MDAIAGTIQGGEIVSRLIREEDLLLCLGFENTEEEREENVNIGISVRKGNTVLKEAIDSYLDTLTVDDFNTIMDVAIKVQPLGE